MVAQAARCMVLHAGPRLDVPPRLRAQLARLGCSSPHVVPVTSTAEAFRSVAALLDGAPTAWCLVDAAWVGHDFPLGDVLADPRRGSSALVARVPDAGRADRADVIVGDGGITGAGSVVHETTGANRSHRGVLRVGAEDVDVLREQALRMAELAEQHRWPADVLRLLLVGLVRAGTAVRPVTLEPFIGDVAVDADHRRQLESAVLAEDERRLRLRGAARPDDGLYSTFVVRRLSRHVTSLAVRTRVSPNQITLISLAVGLAAAGAFAVGSLAATVLGAVLLQVSLVVDCVDGEVARFTRRYSELGGWLDAVTDRVKEYAVYAGLAIGAARYGADLWALAGATIALQAVRHFVDFGFAARQAARISCSRRKVPLEARVVTASGDEDAGPSVSRAAVDLSERTNRSGALMWLKRAVIMPIGERWLVISVVSVILGAQAVFVTLLVLGAVAATYTTAGRVLRTLADPPRWRLASARALLHLGDVVPTVVVRPLVGARLGWLVPAAVRAVEYGSIAWIAVVHETAAAPLFVLLAALAFLHYDVVYRVRQTGEGPARWAVTLGLGAAGRLGVLVVTAAAVPSGLPTVALVLAAVVLAVATTDAGRAWRAWFAAEDAPYRFVQRQGAA